MKKPSTVLKLSLQVLAAEHNLFPNGVKDAANKLHSLLKIVHEKQEKFGLTNALVEDLCIDLDNNFPSESEIKNWFTYDEDFSGLIMYLKDGNKYPVSIRINRSIDLSYGHQYHDNRDLIKNINETKNEDDKAKLMDQLKNNLPNKKN